MTSLARDQAWQLQGSGEKGRSLGDSREPWVESCLQGPPVQQVRNSKQQYWSGDPPAGYEILSLVNWGEGHGDKVYKIDKVAGDRKPEENKEMQRLPGTRLLKPLLVC